MATSRPRRTSSGNALLAGLSQQSNATTTTNDWLLLRYRNAVADKEWAIACANMELSRGGWTCDWSQDIREASIRIAKIEEELDSEKANATLQGI